MAPINERPIRMFIYQPFYTKDADGKKEYLNTKTYKFVYFPVKKGDVFVTEKRVNEFVELTKDQQSKVKAVRYNLSDMTCNVLLEDKIIEKKEEPKEEPNEVLDEIVNPTLRSKADLDNLALETKEKPTAS